MSKSTGIRKPARMAATLSIGEFLKYYLQKNFEHPQDGKEAKATQHQQRMLLATVYMMESDGTEEVIYSRKIAGAKNTDPVAEFVGDMTGKMGNVNGPGLKRSGIVRETNGENSDEKLPRNCSVSVEILASRSPSNVGSDELLRLLEYCKRNSIRISIQFTFAHPYSWDNKYNKEGLQSLSEKGIKLKPLSLQQGLNLMIDDVHDTLETFDELQTSRGTILLNYNTLKRVTSRLREAINVKSDFYFQDNFERLHEILGYQNGSQTNTSCVAGESTNFSLATYRDYFLLQNSDEIWAKIKVDLAKNSEGVTQDHQLFEQIYNVPGPKSPKHGKNNAVKDPLNAQTHLQPLADTIWRLIGDNVTLGELASQDEIVVSITAVISEHPDRMNWHGTVKALHQKLARKIEDADLGKVHVETHIRYAINLNENDNQSQPGTKVNGVSSGVTTECMHVQDILFDMLEDLEDNVKHLESVDFGRGANLRVDKTSVSSALGLLNKAIRIRTGDGKIHSMNSDFTDCYVENLST